jgi:hypothetical protein
MFKSKRKKYQLISIVLLIAGLIIIIPITDWQEKNSVVGFVILSSGIIGSIVSIFIPSNYVKEFKHTEWKGIENEYFIFIDAKTHGLGRSPKIQTFRKDGISYKASSIAQHHDNDGNVTVIGKLTFDGKIVLT